MKDQTLSTTIGKTGLLSLPSISSQ